MVDDVEQRCIILVDEHGHLFARGGIEAAYHTVEFLARCHLVGVLIILLPFEHEVDGTLQLFGRLLTLDDAQVQVNDRILLPLRLHLHDAKSAEQVLLSTKVRLQRGCQQRLAETARPTHENKRCIMGQLPDQIGLVNIDIAFSYHSVEGLYSNRVFSYCCFHRLILSFQLQI